jgi:hypothetical protein
LVDSYIITHTKTQHAEQHKNDKKTTRQKTQTKQQAETTTKKSQQTREAQETRARKHNKNDNKKHINGRQKRMQAM